MYVRYVIVVNALGNIYDQTLQVQKCAVVKEILALATKRLLELRLTLKKIEMSEFMCIDQTLIEQKLNVFDVQVLTPFYYPMQRTDEIEDLLKGVRHSDKTEDEAEKISESKKKSIKYLIGASKVVSPEEQRKLDERNALTKAINLIICHEKARFVV